MNNLNRYMKLKQGCYKLPKYHCKDIYNTTEDFYLKYMWLFQTFKFTKKS